MKLHELKAGDTIYALVPYNNNGYLDYRVEKTSLIQCDIEDNLLGRCVYVEFTYLNYFGERSKITTRVFDTQWDGEYVTYFISEFPKYGMIAFTDNIECLNNVYKNLMMNYIRDYDKRIEELQRHREVYVDKMIVNYIEEV